MAREREYIRATRDVFKSLGYKNPMISVEGNNHKEFGYKLRVINDDTIVRVFSDKDLKDFVDRLFADVEYVIGEYASKQHNDDHGGYYGFCGVKIRLDIGVLADAAELRYLTAAFIDYLLPRLSTEELEGVINARQKTADAHDFWAALYEGVLDDVADGHNENIYALCVIAALNAGGADGMKQKYAAILAEDPAMHLSQAFIYPDSIGVRVNIYADKPDKTPLYFIVFEAEEEKEDDDDDDDDDDDVGENILAEYMD